MKNQKIKKILNWSTFGIFSIGAVVGSVFGINHVVTQDYSKDQQFQDSYVLEAKIINTNPTDPVSLDEATKSLEKRAEFYGFTQATISNSEEGNIIVSFPISSTEEENPYSYNNNLPFAKEIIAAYTFLFSNFNIEFRDLAGNLLFNYDSSNQIVFIPPPLPETPAKAYSTNDSIDQYYSTDIIDEDGNNFIPITLQSYPIQLVANNSAFVSYENGLPLVTFTPANDLLSVFDEAITYMLSQDLAANPTGNQYTVWFGYDTLSFILNVLDPNGLAAAGGDLITYCYTDPLTQTQLTEPQNICEPFFKGVGSVTTGLSAWDTNITLNIGLTVEQSEGMVEQINYSTQNYYFDFVSATYIPATNTTDSLKFVLLTVAIIIAIVIFTMMWYYGLLGLIAAMPLFTFAYLPLILLASFSMPVTATVLFSYLMTILVLILLTFSTLRIIKTTIRQKKKSKKAFIESITNSFQRNISLLAMISITIFAMTIFASGSIQGSLLLGLFAFVISYFGIIILNNLLAFGYFALFNINSLDVIESKTWIWEVGKLTKVNFASDLTAIVSETLEKTTSSKIAKIVTLSSLVFIILTFGVFGIVAGINGNWGNSSAIENAQFQYDIVWNNSFNTAPTSEEGGMVPPNADPNDPYNQVEFKQQTQNDADAIKSVLSSNGIDVKESKITRQDYMQIIQTQLPDGELISELHYSFKYGITIYSDSKMSAQQFNAINAQLATIINPTFNNGGYELELNKSLSAFEVDVNGVALDSSQALLISQTNAQTQSNQIVLGIIVALILVTFMMFMIYKWSIGLSFISITSLELLTTSALFLIFFIPINNVFFLSLFALFLMSVISKSIINREMKKELQRFEEKNDTIIRKAIHNGALRSIIYSMIISISMIFIGGALLSAFGVAMTSFIVVMLIGSIVMFIFNFTIYPMLVYKLESIRMKQKNDLLEADINYSKNPENIEEEFIKGINY